MLPFKQIPIAFRVLAKVAAASESVSSTLLIEVALLKLTIKHVPASLTIQ